MTAPIVSLASAVITAINNAASKSLVRRYVPFYKSSDVENGVWFVMAATEDTTKKRAVDINRLSVDVAYQKALPKSQQGAENPLENNAFLDACMNEVESVKALYREGGALADSALVNRWAFQGMSNNPIYRPDLMLENQIFTSVIRLDFLELQG